jgi:hypothetical protein
MATWQRVAVPIYPPEKEKALRSRKPKGLSPKPALSIKAKILMPYAKK